MEIKKVGVVGCGLMGHGITQVSAQAGYDVVVADVSQEALDKGLGKISKLLGKSVEKGKIEQADADAILGRISSTTELSDFADCDLVIEAVTENLDTKLEIWKQLDGIVKDEAYFATNTSSLPVINQAAATTRPANFLGLHFFNPVQVMPLLEVIQSVTTSPEAMGIGLAYGEKLKKTTVETKDKAGFIVNRLLIPFLNEACFALAEGLGTIEDIDKAIKLGLNHPMGPFTLADLIGLDTCLAIAEVLHRELGEDKYRPAPLLRNYVAAGWLGRKVGRGFYKY